MRIPVWLYARRERSEPFPERVTRIGSRQYGLVATRISGDAYTSPATLATVGPFHFGFGPGGGIEAGFIDAGIRGRLWHVRHGRYLGLGWKPR
jgi:hypothetical protein